MVSVVNSLCSLTISGESPAVFLRAGAPLGPPSCAGAPPPAATGVAGRAEPRVRARSGSDPVSPERVTCPAGVGPDAAVHR